MTDQEIFDKVADIVTMCLPEINRDELTMDSVINTDVNIDSMNFVLILCKAEAAFGFKLPKDGWQDLQTMGDVVGVIKKYAPLDEEA